MHDQGGVPGQVNAGPGGVPSRRPPLWLAGRRPAGRDRRPAVSPPPGSEVELVDVGLGEYEGRAEQDGLVRADPELAEVAGGEGLAGRAGDRLGRVIYRRVAGQIAEVDGLITNGKFCCVRRVRLSLTWWHRPLRLRGSALHTDVALVGEPDDPDLDRLPPVQPAPGRRAPVGSGLPAAGASGRAGRPARPDADRRGGR